MKLVKVTASLTFKRVKVFNLKLLFGFFWSKNTTLWDIIACGSKKTKKRWISSMVLHMKRLKKGKRSVGGILQECHPVVKQQTKLSAVFTKMKCLCWLSIPEHIKNKNICRIRSLEEQVYVLNDWFNFSLILYLSFNVGFYNTITLEKTCFPVLTNYDFYFLKLIK